MDEAPRGMSATPVVVLLTSSSQPEDQERAEALGAALFLTKPPAPEQLRQARIAEGRVDLLPEGGELFLQPE
jgi:CheY-like chemotaxis protein